MVNFDNVFQDLIFSKTTNLKKHKLKMYFSRITEPFK